MNIDEPMDIEKRSMEIIESELGDIDISEENKTILKRVIHTTADFDYANNLIFSENVVANAREIMKKGCDIVTDTNMVKAGINKAASAKLGIDIFCFMSDDDVAEEAKARGITRAAVSMEKSARSIIRPCIYAIGNAPTALLTINRLIDERQIKPALIIAVPVGFVNVVESKELIIKGNTPYIAARGRKGGSNVAAAIVNALMYGVAR